MPYPYYNNQYNYMQNMQDLQNMKEKIDRQMQQMQQLNQNQMQQQPTPTNLTQNFQLAPNPTNNELESKYANNIDEVRNTFVMKTGVFVNKDFTSMWVKTTDGNIKTYELNEVIQMDERDKEIIRLNNQIRELQQSLKENGNNSIEKENNKEKKSNKKD